MRKVCDKRFKLVWLAAISLVFCAPSGDGFAEPSDENAELDLEEAEAAAIAAQTREECELKGDEKLSRCEQEQFRNRISRCWDASELIAVEDPQKYVVTVEFNLDRHGYIADGPKVAEMENREDPDDPNWKTVDVAALKATTSCQPFNMFAADRYDYWKEFTLRFDPREMAEL